MSGPAQTYALITKEVERIVAESGGNDKAQAAYMVARAALLNVSLYAGQRRASEMAFNLADELAGVLPR